MRYERDILEVAGLGLQLFVVPIGTRVPIRAPFIRVRTLVTESCQGKMIVAAPADPSHVAPLVEAAQQVGAVAVVLIGERFQLAAHRLASGMRGHIPVVAVRAADADFFDQRPPGVMGNADDDGLAVLHFSHPEEASRFDDPANPDKDCDFGQPSTSSTLVHTSSLDDRRCLRPPSAATTRYRAPPMFLSASILRSLQLCERCEFDLRLGRIGCDKNHSHSRIHSRRASCATGASAVLDKPCGHAVYTVAHTRERSSRTFAVHKSSESDIRCGVSKNRALMSDTARHRHRKLDELVASMHQYVNSLASELGEECEAHISLGSKRDRYIVSE